MLPALAAALRAALVAEARSVGARTARQVALGAGKKGETDVGGGMYGKLKIDMEEGEKFKNLNKALGKPKGLTQISAQVIIESIINRFEIQGRDVGGWPERKVPSLGGILSDLAKGTNIKASRFAGRPALIDTGAMRKSFDYQLTGASTAVIYSNVDYVDLHQRGGSRVVPVTRTMKNMLEKKRDPEFFKKFGWLLKRDEVTIKVRKRTIVAVTKKDLTRIQDAMSVVLQNATAREISGLTKRGGKSAGGEQAYQPFGGKAAPGRPW